MLYGLRMDFVSLVQAIFSAVSNKETLFAYLVGVLTAAAVFGVRLRKLQSENSVLKAEKLAREPSKESNRQNAQEEWNQKPQPAGMSCPICGRALRYVSQTIDWPDEPGQNPQGMFHFRCDECHVSFEKPQAEIESRL